MPDDLVPGRTGCSDTDGAEGDLRCGTLVGEIRERDYQEDLPEEEPRSLQEQERSSIVLVSITKTLQEAKRIDLIFLLYRNQGRNFGTHRRRMVGRVGLVLQRILGRLLFLDLALFRR